MTALSVVQTHCRLHALAVPTSIINSMNTTTSQLTAILQQIIDEFVTEANYQVTTREAVFTATAAEDQGAMTTLAPYGFQWALPETFFDRTLKRPLYGPLNDVQWQEIKALPNPGPFYKFRIRQGHLLLNPAPTAPLSTIAFEYVSSFAIINGRTSVPTDTISNDNDTFLFPENILQRGLAYYWKQIKGLPYQADEKKYYDLLNNYIVRDKAPPRINVAEPTPHLIKPGIFVPSGNWNV